MSCDVAVTAQMTEHAVGKLSHFYNTFTMRDLHTNSEFSGEV